MSEVSGRFKAKFMYPETNQEGQTPYLRMVFGILQEDVNGEWEDLAGVPNSIASYTYWLKKEQRDGAKMSSYEYSKLRFKKDWGIELDAHPTLDALRDALRDTEKVLIIEEDSESDFHKVKWINNPGGKKREGMVDLQNIL